MSIFMEAAEDRILEEAATWLNTLQEKGIFTQEDIDAIINDESLIIEDVVRFVDTLNSLSENEINYLETSKIINENEDILSTAVDSLYNLYESGELSEDDFINILENEDLTIDDIKEFVTEMTNTQFGDAIKKKSSVSVKKVDDADYLKRIEANKKKFKAARQAKINSDFDKFKKEKNPIDKQRKMLGL